MDGAWFDVAKWRTLAGATILSVATTAGVAAVVGADPAPRRGAGVVASEVASPAVSSAGRPLPPVSEHALDPEVIAALAHPSPAGESVTETIQLTIVGGDLELVTPALTVTLEQVPGSDRDWIASLPAVRVVDARGTGEGWDVRWSLTSLEVDGDAGSAHGPRAKVFLAPADPVVVAGALEGLVAGHAGPAARHGRSLFSADPGYGGGTYEAGGTVTVRLPRDVTADRVAVALAFSLA